MRTVFQEDATEQHKEYINFGIRRPGYLPPRAFLARIKQLNGSELCIGNGIMYRKWFLTRTFFLFRVPQIIMEAKTTTTVNGALRYIDFITSDRNILHPILAALSNELQLPIVHVTTADPTRSGPRLFHIHNNSHTNINTKGTKKEEYAIETFVLGEADFGRL
jgi:hypothetical protein